MENQDREAMGRFAREHRVHYELEREEVARGEGRELVGVDLRLFAMHTKAKLVVPGCPESTELLRNLRSFAEEVVRSGEAAERAEIVPATQALYRSAEEPDADEVSLTVRVRCSAPEHRRPGKGEDPCLGDIRDRLARVGVPRR